MDFMSSVLSGCRSSSSSAGKGGIDSREYPVMLLCFGALAAEVGEFLCAILSNKKMQSIVG